jgi:hypothetical protein
MRPIITKQRLEYAVAVLNDTMGNTTDNAFFIQGAYGGFQLMRKIPGSTAADSVTMGFVPKRELFSMIVSMSTAIALYKDKKAIEEYSNSSLDTPTSV